MVFPVPGLPMKTRWRDMGGTGRPASSRSFRTFTLDVPLDLLQPAQAVQLCQKLLQAGLRGRGLPLLHRRGHLALRRRGSRRFFLRAVGHELIRLEGGAVLGQSVPVAQGQQRVVAGVDKPRLALADHAVHSGKQQKEQCQLVHKAPGQTGPLSPVILPEILEKGRRLKQVKIGDPHRHLPVEGGGHRIPRGVDGVVKFHVPGGDGAGVVRLPEAQHILPHIAVHLPAKTHPEGRVRDELAECGDHFVVLPVDLAGSQILTHAGHLSPHWSGLIIVNGLSMVKPKIALRRLST